MMTICLVDWHAKNINFEPCYEKGDGHNNPLKFQIYKGGYFLVASIALCRIQGYVNTGLTTRCV